MARVFKLDVATERAARRRLGHLAYDNQLMAMLWSTLATRDVRLAEHALSRRRQPVDALAADGLGRRRPAP